MKKNNLSLLIISLIVILLSACNNAGDNSATSKDTVSVTDSILNKDSANRSNPDAMSDPH